MKWLLIIALALLAIFMKGMFGVVIIFVMAYFTINHFLKSTNGNSSGAANSPQSNGLFGNRSARPFNFM